MRWVEQPDHEEQREPDCKGDTSESVSAESGCRHGLRSARAALAIDGSELDLSRVSKNEREV